MPTTNAPIFSGSDPDFIQQLNAYFATLDNAINTHHAEILAAIGPGALLIEDIFDRDGVVGEQSYQLDIPNYAGGATITIGRRPVPILARGEKDVSVAWLATLSGRIRVTLTADLILTAAGVITGLPKTIFIRVGSSGVPQVLETEADTNLLTLYKATWNGFSWLNITRVSPILPGYPLFMALAGHPRQNQVYDGDTNWIDPGILDSDTEIVTHGDPLDNEIGLNAEVEILGFFIHPHRNAPGFFSAPSANPPESKVILRVRSAGETWSAKDLDIDCGQAPDSIFVGVASAIGSKRFVNEVRRFRLELVSVGSGVVSARGFTWGVEYAPLFGASVPKDSTAFEQI